MKNVHINFDKKKCFKYNDLIISFKGLLFYKDHMSGIESLKHFFNDFPSYMDGIKYLRGNFIICIEDKSSTYVFTDNSGMSRLYYYNDLVFDKYLNLINYFKLNIKDLDNFGIVEYIQYGYSIFYTPFKNVKILGRNEIIKYANNIIDIKEKMIDNLFINGEDIKLFYGNFKNNFADKKIACDLTAGIDSRLNAALLKNSKIDFKASISGKSDHIDVIKCHEIAKILDVDVLQFELDNKFDYSIVDKIFLQLDGQYSILEFYKNYILTNGLVNDDIDLRISGAGGEMYKYSWFAEDLPHFNKKKFSLEKIYNRRFLPRSVKYNFYTNSFTKKINMYQKELKNKLEMYRCNNNVKTYDKLCYETVMRFGSSAQMIQFDDNYVRYAPLLELSIVRNGVNLSIKDRLLYMYHRKLITNSFKEISKIKTNKGLTVNKSLLSIFSDLLKLFWEFVIKIKNRVFKIKIFKDDEANSNKIFYYIKQNDSYLINILKKNNIINESFNNKTVDNQTYSRLITIAKIIDYIGANHE